MDDSRHWSSHSVSVVNPWSTGEAAAKVQPWELDAPVSNLFETLKTLLTIFQDGC
jgi:hypothetical protein